MAHQSEVFVRDLEQASDEAESALLRALIVYTAVNDQDEDEEDGGLLALFLRSAVVGLIVAVINLTERHSDQPPVSQVDRDRITQQALETARRSLRVAVQADPQMLSGAGDASRAERLRDIAGSVITSVRSETQQNLAGMFDFGSKTWVTRLDRLVRSSHRRLEGVTIPVGDRFETTGGSLRFPGDPSAPPQLIVNCRCLLRFST